VNGESPEVRARDTLVRSSRAGTAPRSA